MYAQLVKCKCSPVLFRLVEQCGDALMQSAPVGLMSKESQQVGPVERDCTQSRAFTLFKYTHTNTH